MLPMKRRRMTHTPLLLVLLLACGLALAGTGIAAAQTPDCTLYPWACQTTPSASGTGTSVDCTDFPWACTSDPSVPTAAASAAPAQPPDSQTPSTGTTTTDPSSGVSITTSSNGFTFTNNSSQWLWVSFAILNCQDVDWGYGCNSGGAWTQTVSLGPNGYDTASQACALMEAINSQATSYSYTVQWLAYADSSNGTQWQPDATPQYAPDLGIQTPVTEQAGTDNGADTCIPFTG